MKKLILFVAAILLAFSAAQAQYVWDDTFPSDTLIKGSQTHGIAVDPYGRAWVITWTVVRGDSMMDVDGKNYACYAIRIYNSDGSQASFSPIKILSGAGIQDTLWAAPSARSVTQRGIATDKDGNILYSSFDRLFRINYKTGAAMGKVIPRTGASLTQVAADTLGNVFTAQVANNAHPIQMYDASFIKQGNVSDTTRFFSRAIACNKAGDQVYFAGYTGHAVIRYTGDPLLGFTPDTVLKGFDCEAINRHGKTDMLWAAAGSGNDMPNRYPGVVTSYSAHTWYLWDPATDKMKDSIKWAGGFLTTLADSQGVRPRGVATTANGDTVYVAMFGSKTGMYPVQRFIKKSLSVRREEGLVAENFSLSQNYPNPFNPSTQINFSLLTSANISLKVYDILGKEIATLASGDYAAGSYKVDFDASNLSAGMYFYTLHASNGFSQTKKMVLVK